MKDGTDEIKELAEAGALADRIDQVIAQSGASWGVIGVAMATAIASAVHQSQPNPGTGRRLVNETHALCRQLLVELSNGSLSDKTRITVREMLHQDDGRAWTGSKERQADLVRKVLATLDGVTRTDAAAVVETILANIVCDRASSLQHADRGLDAVMGDMRRIAIQRFDSGRHAASRAQGNA